VKAEIKVLQISERGLWVMMIFAMDYDGETREVIATIYAESEYDLIQHARSHLSQKRENFKDTLKAIDSAFEVVNRHEMGILRAKFGAEGVER
jgi:hypothetical protein